jgi:adenosine deaminase
MFEKNKSDLHCHLNGSFSLEFLEKLAKKNGCGDVYIAYKKLRQEYLEATTKQPSSGYPKNIIDMIWGLFGLIHKMVQDLDDITQGTIAVVKNSQAKYLEIRTTPKAMANSSRNDYIDAFEAGLNAVKKDGTIQKTAYGLLSLDRTLHTVDDAAAFIQCILKSPNKVLVGLDVSGNPLGKRTLSGNDLAKVVTMALESNVNIAIHMGESDTDIEKKDTDAVLNALEQWKQKQPDTGKNPFFGRVRLGHCIYLTKQQQQKIHTLGLPIEVCPTCHKKTKLAS